MNKLILIWHNEGSNTNVIGELIKEQDYYTFKYTNFELNDLQLFSEKGLFPGFFDINTFYKSKFLFQNIKDRLPQENRVDYYNLLEQYNIKNPKDEFEVLTKTEGKINSDNFKFVTQEKLFELQKNQ
ncbi:MAG: hypothetical protein PHX04_00645 [Bacilli bacterium]|nr:hypothetical protein [Bacilli bacterium]